MSYNVSFENPSCCRILSVFFLPFYSTHQTPEAKREEFRRYLERSGAIDSLTSVLVGLYEEHDRPPESTEYIRKSLGGGAGGGAIKGGAAGGGGAGAALASNHQQHQENEKLRKENKELKNQVKELNKTVETLRANLKHSREEAKKARQTG